MLKFLTSVLVANARTVYYAVKLMLTMVLHLVTHPFGYAWTPKLRLMAPDVLKDPKYGTHKYMKVNGVKIHYVESGDSSKPLMVFMHGFPEFWYSWRHQILHFKRNYWCVALDMRGYGDSEKPEEQSAYKITNMAADLRDLVRQLGREKMILVAHDWGGCVGWCYRELYPETLIAYVSLASTSLWALKNLILTDPEQFRKSWYVFFFRAWWVPELAMTYDDLHLLQETLSGIGDSKVTDEDIECYKYTFGKPGAFTPPINYYRANFQYVPPGEPAPCNHPVPCLLALAADDAFITAKNTELVLRQFPRTETVTLEKCGHFCQQENPEKVNTLIEQFLAKHNL